MGARVPIVLLGLTTGCAGPAGTGPSDAVGSGVATTGATGATTDPIGLPAWNGTLAEARDRILGELTTGADTEGFAVPDADERDDFREIAARLAVGNTDVGTLAASNGYEAVVVRDTVNDRDVVVVWEPVGADHRGALVVALDPDARPVVLESPHTQHDTYTGYETYDLFVGLRARAWVTSTAHRCANAAYTPCSGTATACADGNNPYRESDAAHATAHAFQAWHEGLTDADGALVAVQIHGFGWTDPEPAAYLGNGTSLTGDPDALANRVAAELDLVLPTGAASCNLAADVGIARQCGTLNTQGRYTNGSPDPCTEDPATATDRFLHVEQSIELRGTTGPVNRTLLLQALDAALPR